MNLESLIRIIEQMRDEYNKSYCELAKHKHEDLTESITQIRDLACLSGAEFALGKVLELVEEDKKGIKE